MRRRLFFFERKLATMTDTTPQAETKTEARARRLRAMDFKDTPTSDNVVELTLADILLQTAVLTDADDEATIVIKPINFKGLALLETAVGQDALLQLATGTPQWGTMLKIVVVLVNQDLPPHQQMSEEEIGRLIDAKKAGLVSELAMEMLNPLLEGGTQTEATETAPADRHVGTKSSTFAQANSDGQ